MHKPDRLDEHIPDPHSAGQYCEADCLELVGRDFRLSMEDGEEYAVAFLGGGAVSFSKLGSCARVLDCRCLKLADGTYFLFPGGKDTQAETPLYAALDLQTAQITLVNAGANPTPRFGAVAACGEPVLDEKSALSKDLEGTAILWRLGPQYGLLHRYGTDGQLRIAAAAPWEPAPETDGKAAEAAFVVKLREDVYFIAAASRAGAPLPELQLMLADTNSIRFVGCCRFGGTSVPVAVSGYGAFLPPVTDTQKEAVR